MADWNLNKVHNIIPGNIAKLSTPMEGVELLSPTLINDVKSHITSTGGYEKSCTLLISERYDKSLACVIFEMNLQLSVVHGVSNGWAFKTFITTIITAIK